MGVHTKNLMGYLLKAGCYRYVVVSNTDYEAGFEAILKNHGVETRIVRWPLPVYEQVTLPRIIASVKPDLCWFPSNTFPIFKPEGAKYVVTLHDVIFMDESLHPTQMVQKLGKIYRRWVLENGWKKIDRLTSVSMDAFKSILHVFPCKTEKLADSVIYPMFIPCRPDARILKAYGLKENGFFYTLTGSAPSKNADMLIKAFNLFSVKNGAKESLVVSGVAKEVDRRVLLKYAESPEIRKRIIFTDYVDEAAKYALMKSAKAFIFPSLSEGFGIPLIEALCYSRRVLASNIGIFREVGGKGCEYFDPRDPADLVRKLSLNAKSRSPNITRRYVEKKFNVAESAEKLTRIFNRVLEDGRKPCE